MSRPTVAVLGASGFVGSATAEALRQSGCAVVPRPAPRLSPDSRLEEITTRLARDLSGVDAVINAAGIAEATGSDHDRLHWANAVLPGVVGKACAGIGARFVHVSSAAVQGRRPCLDDSMDTHPSSPYSRSKAAGELQALESNPDAIVYRPPGVHGPTRSVTRAISRFAASPLTAVAAPGSANTPQALITNVADAVAFLATCPRSVPRIVHHPSEGLTTARLLALLGGREPRLVPHSLAQLAVRSSFVVARQGSLWSHARRLEMLWLGQDQSPSWLSLAGWSPRQGHDAWSTLGEVLRSRSEQATTVDEKETE